MSKKKLLHITSSLQMGGAERTLYNLIKYLRTNFEQTVVYFHDGPFVEKIEQCDVRTIQIKGYFGLYDPIFFWRLLKVINQCSPDIIHSLLWAANISSRIGAFLLKKPLINVYHNNVDQNGYVRSMLDAWTAMLCDQPVAVSDQVAHSIAPYWRAAKKIAVIPNGIEEPQMRYSKTRGDLGISADDFVIGAVGRFVKVKSFDLLLKAAAHVLKLRAHVRVVLIGSGPEESYLRQVAQDLNISGRVQFITGVSAIDYYSIFDCFVQSSAKEGVSLALLEAMHNALPCIVMGDFFVHPVINHGVDGFVCDVGNAEMLAQRITALICDSQISSLLGKKAKVTVKRHFSLDTMIHQYEKLFKDLCNKSAK